MTDNWRGKSATIHSFLLKNPGWHSFGEVSGKTGIDIDIVGSLADAEVSLFDVRKDGKFLKLKHEQFEAPPPPSSCTEAANAVSEYAERLRTENFQVESVVELQKVLDRYVHRVALASTDEDHAIAEDTPLDWVSDNGLKARGTIVGFDRDDQTCYVALSTPVSNDDLPAKLRVDSAFAAKKLAEYLRTLQGEPPLFTRLAQTAPSCRDHSIGVVAMWLARRPAPWAHALWGPPGGGKTSAIAQLCTFLSMSENSERILFVAPSNVAVDTATERLADVLAQVNQHSLLDNRAVYRCGYPRSSRLLNDARLLGPPELKKQADDIAADFRNLRKLSSQQHEEKAKLKTAVNQKQKDLKDKTADAVRSAKVVLTTITTALDPEGPILKTKPFTTVIADEASMIGGASLLALASLADRRFLIAGDPKQLGPVVKWNRGHQMTDAVQKWLGCDAFEFAAKPWVEISAQRRCHPEIWSLVSKLYPGVETLRANSASVPSNPKLLVDLSGGRSMDSQIDDEIDDNQLARDYQFACVKAGRSWKNPPTARRAVELAQDIAGENPETTIAIITPYRAQARLIKKWLEEDAKHGSPASRIEVGTVHSFQGGEADVVILDVVDGPPRSGLGELLSGETANRLLNVAVTRAKNNLFVLAHKEWVRRVSTQHRALYDIVFSNGLTESTIRVTPTPRVDYGPTESYIENLLYQALLKMKDQLPPLALQYEIHDEKRKIITRADFAFPTIKLVVYCHGATDHLKHRQWQKDLRQANELTRLGWKINAFSGWQIKRDLDACIQQLQATIASLTKIDSSTGRRAAGSR